MRKPNDSLDDFVVKPAPEISAEPPRRAVVRLTGEVEVLKPLARWEHPVKLVRAVEESSLRPAPHRLSWFHRSLALGGGLAAIALVLTSAIVIGISDSPSDSLVAVPANHDAAASEVREENAPAPADEPLESDIFISPVQVSKSRGNARRNRARAGRVYATRPLNRTPVRVASRVAAKKPAVPMQLVSKFTPTTLVIYIEDGVIRTRTEPWANNDRNK